MSEETNDEKDVMDELRTEMAAKAKAAGVRVHHTWDAARIEQAISEAALQDPTEPADENQQADSEEVVALKSEIAGLEAQVAGLLDEIRSLTGAPDQTVIDEASSEPLEAGPAQADAVTCTVTKNGAGKISNGAGGFFNWKDSINLPLETAGALEDRAFVEIDE